jgi:AbrB family looped-hinge helix DNA binding protein
MKITSKGQVTIPQEIREKHGLLPNTEVDFVVERGRVFLKSRNGRQSAAQRLRDHYRSAPRMRMSSKELLALLRDPPDELDAD